jgi:xanthine dehydrogenase accessory factor
VCAPVDELATQVPLAHFAAAVVMSHHLATDRSYLAALAPTAIPYIGLLGPPGRRDRLLRELGHAATALGDRLHGPAGLDIGADSPESIALSILGQIHAMTRHGR